MPLYDSYQIDFYKFDSKSIRQAFRDVGLALPIDSSRDNEIKIKDILDLEVKIGKVGLQQGGIPQPFDKKHETVSLADLGISMITTTMTTTTTTTKIIQLDSWLDTVTSDKTLDKVEADRHLPDLFEDSEDEYI